MGSVFCWTFRPSTEQIPLFLTDILIARSQHDTFINAENVSSGETVGPATSGQISNHRGLTVWSVLVRLGAVARIETDLRKSRTNQFMKRDTDSKRTVIIII